MGLTTWHLHEFVQSRFLDGFLLKYLIMIIYYKILSQFGVQYCQQEAFGLGCYQCRGWNPVIYSKKIYYTNCIIQISTTQFVLYKLYTNCIVQILTQCGFCTNSYKQIHTIVIQIVQYEFVQGVVFVRTHTVFIQIIQYKFIQGVIFYLFFKKLTKHVTSGGVTFEVSTRKFFSFIYYPQCV